MIKSSKLKDIIYTIGGWIKQEGFLNAVDRICKAGFARTVSISYRLKNNLYFRLTLPTIVDECHKVWVNADTDKCLDIKRQTLNYISSNEKSEKNIGAYSYISGGPPLLYASCYAALTRHLFNDLDAISQSDRSLWISYIQKYQSDDGLFRDPLINIPLAEEIDWWGWRHLTLHALMALNAVGGVAERKFEILQPFHKKGRMSNWLESRNWKKDPASVSNEIQNYGTMLQYARDFQHELWCDDVLREMYGWLDERQNPQTGLWGNSFNTPLLLSSGVQTGYHLWLLYFYDRRPLQYIEKIIDSCLATQNKLGGFGVAMNSSACEDIDTIDPLIRLHFISDYRHDDILKALEKSFTWVMANANDDGGWVFRRREAFQYGHPLMTADSDESSMFPTWFRILSLAYLSKVLDHKINTAFEWQFLNCPGHQFWRCS